MRTADNKHWTGFQITEEDVSDVLNAHGIASPIDDPRSIEILSSFTLEDFETICQNIQSDDAEQMTIEALKGLESLMMAKELIPLAEKKF